jgi:hypothetical protein
MVQWIDVSEQRFNILNRSMAHSEPRPTNRAIGISQGRNKVCTSSLLHPLFSDVSGYATDSLIHRMSFAMP